MRLLLDTHIWIWNALEPRRLSPRFSGALADPANELWLSPISIWELTILVRKGRIVLDAPVDEWVARGMRAFPLKEAPVTLEVALATAKIHIPHGDPADAFLAATAQVFELTLVTADRGLRGLKGISVL